MLLTRTLFEEQYRYVYRSVILSYRPCWSTCLNNCVEHYENKYSFCVQLCRFCLPGLDQHYCGKYSCSLLFLHLSFRHAHTGQNLHVGNSPITIELQVARDNCWRRAEVCRFNRLRLIKPDSRIV